ncbi:8-amino-7-oxononanoate synthase [Lachnellula subtilissima]|uniref:8-amino-7-oxononanoate synthase n=1 Tax=Lachnellula subtilissima TaxID=602034 RepID=A0A8H8RXR1_9HELO|nr:8-amino-7-oxononanoate synthase [Lachnellula subtilissima]
MYSDILFKTWLQEQTPRAPLMKNEPAFYRRLEQSLDKARKDNGLITVKPRWDDTVVDLTTSDFLSLNRTGRIREAFKSELARHGDFVSAPPREIADFHNSETAWIAHSGFFANVGVLEAVLLPGDAIVYDELSHASTILGMKVSMAAEKIPFKHNSLDSLRDVLESLKNSGPAFASGEQSILICVESVYSMEGDICPLKEFVDLAKEMFPAGNAQFIIDEAHSSGVIGPKGSGLVQMLGLEKEISIRLHMCSKALASTGGVILCNKTIRSTIIQNSRALTYSGAPSFPMVASIRAGYQLLISGETQKAQDDIQRNAKYFFELLTTDPICEEAIDEGLLTIPLADDWEQRSIHSHIIPIKTPSHIQLYPKERAASDWFCTRTTQEKR